MQNPIVRIQEIELTNFKNVENGIITMPSVENKDFFSFKSDILGVYGQNGTGKTAIIEAIEIIERLLTGNSLAEETIEYITQNKPATSIKITFIIDFINKVKVEYFINLKRDNENLFIINIEKLSVATWNDEKFGTLKEILVFNADNHLEFTPQITYNKFIKELRKDYKKNKVTGKKNAEMQVFANNLLAQNNKTSSIFNRKSLDLFFKHFPTVNSVVPHILYALYYYSHNNLFLVPNSHTGAINAKVILPLSFRAEQEKSIHKGDFLIPLDEPLSLDTNQYEIAKKVIDTINIALPQIIPSLSIEIKEGKPEILSDGEEGITIQLLSKRGDLLIPIGLESSGIIKIISILNALIYVYSNPSACLIVDELDAGIFEYLLGELLSVFKNNAKGQIIFTSHNLRPLEVLETKNILFSTATPSQRYIRMKGVKPNNNLRDVYLRTIILGGQSESLYMETDKTEIARFFRKAGKVAYNGNK